MQSDGLSFGEAGSKRIPVGASIQEIEDWRTKELEAGRPSGLDDYCRAHGIDLCTACMGEGVTRHENGIGFKPVGWDGNTELFERCPVCGGTGRMNVTG